MLSSAQLYFDQTHVKKTIGWTILLIGITRAVIQKANVRGYLGTNSAEIYATFAGNQVRM